MARARLGALGSCKNMKEGGLGTCYRLARRRHTAAKGKQGNGGRQAHPSGSRMQGLVLWLGDAGEVDTVLCHAGTLLSSFGAQAR